MKSNGKVDYRSDVAFDISPFEKAPCKQFTDDEIRAAYPGIPIVRRVSTPQEQHDRVLKNLRLMHSASKKKSGKFIYGE